MRGVPHQRKARPNQPLDPRQPQRKGGRRRDQLQPAQPVRGRLGHPGAQTPPAAAISSSASACSTDHTSERPVPGQRQQRQHAVGAEPLERGPLGRLLAGEVGHHCALPVGLDARGDAGLGAQPGVLTVGRHQQSRPQAAAVRQGQLRRILAEADRLALGRGQHGQVRLSPQRPPQGGDEHAVLHDGGKALDVRIVGAEHDPAAGRIAEHLHLHDRRDALARASGQAPQARRKASLPGLMAYTRTSQPPGCRLRRLRRGARSTSARLSPLPARARARLSPTSPPPTIATSNCIRVRVTAPRCRGSARPCLDTPRRAHVPFRPSCFPPQLAVVQHWRCLEILALYSRKVAN